MRARRAIALAGNTVALVLLGLLLAGQGRLFGDGSSASGEDDAPRPASARLLVVVLDALREDTARDAALMPRLAALAEGGARGVWSVNLLVPSTIGALETIVEGRTPPPVAALRDFGARPAEAGGWLEDVVATGGESFVAGPDLWTERYGRWVSASHVEPGMPDARSDARIASAARRALTAGDEGAPRVVVAHLGELDATAHRHGACGVPWRAAARRVDAHLGALLDAAGDGRTIVVLADHGTSCRGGHAGAERAVRRAPIVVAPATPEVAVAVREGARPHALIARLLAGEEGSVPTDGARPVAPDDAREAIAGGTYEAAAAVEHAPAFADVRAPTASPGLDAGSDADRASLPRTALSVAALSLLGVLVLGRVATLARRFAPGFAASAALWIAIGLLVVGQAGLAAVCIVAALVALAASGRLSTDGPEGPARRGPEGRFPAVGDDGSLVRARRTDADGLARIRVVRPPVHGRGTTERPAVELSSAGSAVRARETASAAAPFPANDAPLAAAFAFGAALALVTLALAVTVARLDASPHRAIGLVAAPLVGVVCGLLAARVRAPLVAGCALAASIVLAIAAGGETLSLSSLDLGLAHRAAGLVAGPGGIALAVPVALARLALPILAVLIAYRRGRARAGGDSPGRALGVATGVAACQLGAAAVHGLCLALGPALEQGVASDALPPAAAGLGGLLREGVATPLVFVALVLGSDRDREAGRRPAPPPTG